MLAKNAIAMSKSNCLVRHDFIREIEPDGRAVHGALLFI